MEIASYCGWEKKSMYTQCVAPRYTQGTEGGRGFSEEYHRQ